MKIIYTLTISKSRKSYDIQVSSDQTLADTIRVLRDNTHMLDGIGLPIHMTNAETGRELDILETYEKQRIYSGAELIIDE